MITPDLSHLADACVEAAYRLATRNAIERHGAPIGDDGRPGRFVVLALGKLGGEELNYSSDIDLIYLYDEEGRTDGHSADLGRPNIFARVGGEVVRLLSDHTPIGRPYRVDMRLRPDGEQGPLARSLAATLGYYETTGRTWERQALIKCRPVAGDLDLGRTFLRGDHPLRLSPLPRRRRDRRDQGDEAADRGSHALRRRRRAGGQDGPGRHPRCRVRRPVPPTAPRRRVPRSPAHQHAARDGAGWSRSAASPPRSGRSWKTPIASSAEWSIDFRLMFDRQTHRMPSRRRGACARWRSAWAIRRPPPGRIAIGPAQRFRAAHRGKTELNRRILNHLLHDAFPDDAARVDPVVDLVLDPDPARTPSIDALGSLPVPRPPAAYRNLLALAREDIAFLSGAPLPPFPGGDRPEAAPGGRRPPPTRTWP